MKLARLTFALVLLTTTAAFGQTKSDKPMMKVNPEYAEMGMVFRVDDPAGRNTITFRSEAPLEDIIGTTNAISGYLVFDPANPTKGGRGELVVPVASLNTGIPMRDEHLRGEAWLNAGQYPDITLNITDVRNVKPVKSTGDFQTYEMTAVGQFTMRGTTKSIEAPGRITYMKESEKTRARRAGNLLAARASFHLTLADFGVSGPEGMAIIGSKVGETISVDVSIVAGSEEMMAGKGEVHGKGSGGM